MLPSTERPRQEDRCGLLRGLFCRGHEERKRVVKPAGSLQVCRQRQTLGSSLTR